MPVECQPEFEFRTDWSLLIFFKAVSHRRCIMQCLVGIRKTHDLFPFSFRSSHKVFHLTHCGFLGNSDWHQIFLLDETEKKIDRVSPDLVLSAGETLAIPSNRCTPFVVPSSIGRS